ncbi:uncharacterized protein TNIN_91041 [Trichonephila inaurata madagascariensis]|uniref:Uncharacterized protein n=1 Tax=Trichonephila inaurata madagascariensis TaxID=2747483 RepID=A0A8X6YN73_9ARAC|nr:uncharacterized protein TNIN_91041 [Trichonephila inaurata madagascariensis]
MSSPFILFSETDVYVSRRGKSGREKGVSRKLCRQIRHRIHGFNGRGFNCQVLDDFGIIFWALGILKEFYLIFEIRHGSSCNNATTMVQLCNGKCRSSGKGLAPNWQPFPHADHHSFLFIFREDFWSSIHER